MLEYTENEIKDLIRDYYDKHPNDTPPKSLKGKLLIDEFKKISWFYHKNVKKTEPEPEPEPKKRVENK